MKNTLTILILFIIFCSLTFAQVDGESSNSRSIDEGKISLERTEFEVYKKDFKYLLRRKRPLVKISFADGKEINEDSIDKVEGILETHWEDAITFYYKQVFEKSPNADVSKKWENELLKKLEFLKTYTLNAPNGSRNLSHNEASEILSLFNKSAAEIIETAKNLKGEFQEAKILTKLSASSSRCKQSTGQTRILITLDKSGKVTNAEIKENSGCKSFDKNSLKVAKKMKFKPAQVGNEPVTVKKTVVYQFRRF